METKYFLSFIQQCLKCHLFPPQLAPHPTSQPTMNSPHPVVVSVMIWGGTVWCPLNSMNWIWQITIAKEPWQLIPVKDFYYIDIVGPCLGGMTDGSMTVCVEQDGSFWDRALSQLPLELRYWAGSYILVLDGCPLELMSILLILFLQTPPTLSGTCINSHTFIGQKSGILLQQSFYSQNVHFGTVKLYSSTPHVCCFRVHIVQMWLE